MLTDHLELYSEALVKAFSSFFKCPYLFERKGEKENLPYIGSLPDSCKEQGWASQT